MNNPFPIHIQTTFVGGLAEFTFKLPQCEFHMHTVYANQLTFNADYFHHACGQALIMDHWK